MKPFCIIIGVVMLAATIIPYPYGLLIDSTVRFAVLSAVSDEIAQGTLSVNPDAVVSLHAARLTGGSSPATEYEIEFAVQSHIADDVAKTVAPHAMRVMVATFLLGVIFIVIGFCWPRPRAT
jgi:hypothetical protein